MNIVKTHDLRLKWSKRFRFYFQIISVSLSVQFIRINHFSFDLERPNLAHMEKGRALASLKLDPPLYVRPYGMTYSDHIRRGSRVGRGMLSGVSHKDS